MEKPCVVLFCSQQLLGESLEQVIQADGEFDLLGPWNLEEADLPGLDRPAVFVIAEAGDCSQHAAALTALILEQYPEAPVIYAGLEDNRLRVYNPSFVPASRAGLVETIRRLAASVAGDGAGK